MSLSEIGHRIGQKMVTRKDRSRYGAQMSSHGRRAIPEDSWQRYQQESAPSFFFSAANRNEVRLSYGHRLPAEYRATLRTAQQLLDDQFTLFGRHLDLGKEIDWQRDPVTGNHWPNGFYGNIDIRDGKKIGGIKWVWELNRHYHLVTLAKAYYLTSDEAYAQEVSAQLRQWIDAQSSWIRYQLD